MRFTICVLLALVAVACQSSLPTTAVPGGTSPQGAASRVDESTPTVVIAAGAADTATSTPSPSATATQVPSATPTPHPTWPTGAPELVRGDTTQPFVAISLDAGAGAEYTPAILRILKEKDVQATVFLTGLWTEENPSLARQIVADGHEIGNHSYDHPDFTTITSAKIIDQVTRAERIIEKATGVNPKPFFRYPFGARDAQAKAALTELGYRSIYWTLDSTDWREETTPESEVKYVMTHVGKGDILVFHLNAQPTSKCLGQIIDLLRDRGFTLGKVSQLPM